MSKSLPKFGKFSDITSLNKLSVPFTLYSSEIPVIRISFLLAVLYRLCRLSLPTLFFLFFLFRLGYFKIPILYLIDSFFSLFYSSSDVLYWFFHFIHWSLQFQNFCWFFFLYSFYSFLKFQPFIKCWLCVVYLILLSFISLFSCGSPSSLKQLFWIFLLGEYKSQISIILYCYRKIIMIFCDVFLLFFVFFGVLKYIQIWSSSHLFQFLLTAFRTEITFISSAIDSEVFSVLRFFTSCSLLWQNS